MPEHSIVDLERFYILQKDFSDFLQASLNEADALYKAKESEADIRFTILEDQFWQLTELAPPELEDGDQINITKVKSPFSRQSVINMAKPEGGLIANLKHQARKLMLQEIAEFGSITNVKYRIKSRRNFAGYSTDVGDSVSLHSVETSMDPMDPRQDSEQRPKSTYSKKRDYKAAKKQLKLALKEHY